MLIRKLIAFTLFVVFQTAFAARADMDPGVMHKGSAPVNLQAQQKYDPKVRAALKSLQNRLDAYLKARQLKNERLQLSLVSSINGDLNKLQERLHEELKLKKVKMPFKAYDAISVAEMDKLLVEHIELKPNASAGTSIVGQFISVCTIISGIMAYCADPLTADPTDYMNVVTYPPKPGSRRTGSSKLE